MGAPPGHRGLAGGTVRDTGGGSRRLLRTPDDADTLPLFAGWRGQHCPGNDPVGAAMQRIHVLREHRGACHLAAVRLCGLSARAAMVINLGVEQATRYGWQEPHPVAGCRSGTRVEASGYVTRSSAPCGRCAYRPGGRAGGRISAVRRRDRSRVGPRRWRP
ncbi:hypothetical protein [Streptomyces sp. NPDC096132]|uniref:helix-turn-helix domain-containing protein n=1 Tax=Streptomyces sp. NPDC096132 TaxID=3366075 RepID=UPI0038153D5F